MGDSSHCDSLMASHTDTHMQKLLQALSLCFNSKGGQEEKVVTSSETLITQTVRDFPP